ncbi:hypothetical protein GO491_01180 [Flavobacteriaceae bacterium Ap0902]|nr:hypothetical protein [Flavobacteriaceae bacterium Ap0902]
MSKIVLFLALFFFFSCQDKNQNDFSHVIKEDYKTDENKKGFSLKLDSAIYFKNLNRIEIMGKVVNYTKGKIYFPVIQEHPYLGIYDDGYEKETLKFYGFLIKGYEEGKLVEIPWGQIPMYGFYSPDIEIDFDNLEKKWDTLFNYYFTMNKGKIENLKKEGKPIKNSFNWVYRYELYEKNNFLINPYSHKNFNIILNCEKYINPFNNEYSYNTESFCFDVDNISVSLISDSVEFKKEILLENDIEYFKQNHIQIFNGTLESNKVSVMRK